jgi:hypothetical protein
MDNLTSTVYPQSRLWLINVVTAEVDLGEGNFTGNATSMIGLCQEGKSSPDALRRSAGVNPF